MQYRAFGRTGWQVSEIGYGMWGMGGWTGSDDAESLSSLDLAIELGCNFFDTAWAYGEGHSERLLGKTVKKHADKRLYTASKIPPKNRTWPAKEHFKIDEVFPADYIVEYTHKSLANLGLESLDLMQFHVWNDQWANDDRWQNTIADLKRQGLVKAFGISINRWEPANAIQSLRTGAIDAVQVVYNIFDQNPEDELFPVCDELNIAVIARVPFDEGTLTGNLTKDSKWPGGDFRNLYFGEPNLSQSVQRAEKLRQIIPSGMTMPDLALRFILENPTVSTIIPGMRKPENVRSNIATSDGAKLDKGLMDQLRQHRWVRKPGNVS